MENKKFLNNGGGDATPLSEQDNGFWGIVWEKLLRYYDTKALRSNIHHSKAEQYRNSRSFGDLLSSPLAGEGRISTRGTSVRNSGEGWCQSNINVGWHYKPYNKIDKGANTNYNSNMMNYNSVILRKNRTFFTKSKILEKVVKRVQGDKEPHSIHSTHFTHAKRAAFTLAEVLITLGIIGIVAALTIPNLVVKYQRKVMQTRFQKAYSILTEVNTRMIAENINQYRDFVLTEKDENGKYSEEARNRQLDTLASFLNGAKVCNGSYYSCSGIEDAYDFPDKIHKTLDGQNNAHIAADAYMKKTVITNDGMDIWAGGLQFGIDKYYVDTNGYNNGPNKLGYDLFRFVINSNGTVTPEKDSGARNKCSFISPAESAAYLGFGCAYYAWKNVNPDALDDPSQDYWNDFLK